MSEIRQAHRLLAQGKPEDGWELISGYLENEPDDLNALLVGGACLQKLHRDEESLDVLRHAASIDSKSISVWKGLARSYFYSSNVEGLFNASLQTLRLLATGPARMDQARIEEEARTTFENMRSHIQKLAQKLRKASKASKFAADADPASEYAEKLLLLQTPPHASTPEEFRQVYELLEVLRPPVLDPHALQELIYHRQTRLKSKLASIDARQKQTIGYTPAKALTDRLEAIKTSELAELLRLQVSTENDDEIRRAAESQLLELLVSELEFAVQSAKKSPRVANLQAEVHELVDRMAMFEPSKPLAWELAWDWDPPSLDASAYPQLETKSQKKRSKKSGKSKHSESGTETESEVGGEAASTRSSVSSTRSSHEDIGESLRKPLEKLQLGEPQVLTSELAVVKYSKVFGATALGKVLRAFLSPKQSYNDAAPTYMAYRGSSVFGLVLCAKFFVSNGGYEAAIDAVHGGLRAAKHREAVFGMDMSDAALNLKMILALSYTHFQAPKNFGLARDLYDEVLASTPDNIDALVGKGLVLSQQGEQDEARAILERAIELDELNELARGELSWLFVQQGDLQRGIDGLRQCLALHNTPGRNAELHFRIGYALWLAKQFDKSFESFVDALAASPNYAPAFTYLGLFYEDVAGDKQRAQRCYYRALELDNGELLAGERLAADFANHSQWDLVEVVASSVLSSSKLKGLRGVDWPYRAMGIVCLNQLRYEDAVKYFQRCLRSQSSDVQAWIGLGEAYIHGGRYNSAEKALTRALKIEPENFSAHYVLSLAHREMLNFPGSSRSLELAIKYAPESSAALQWAFADNALRAANFFVGESRFGEAELELEHALRSVAQSVAGSTDELGGVFWGSATEICFELQDMGYAAGVRIPTQFESLLQNLAARASPSSNYGLAELAEAFAQKYVELAANDTKPRRVSAHMLVAEALRRNAKLGEAVVHYQTAIQLEPRNEALWSAYGVALQNENPHVAQHCFVRALSLNGRNADTWTNLGGLYLTVGDAELALEAVDRALSLEADNTRAWVTQALAETVLKSKTDEQLYRTLEYAQQLDSNDVLANFALALKEFERKPAKPSPASIGGLVKLLSMRKNNKTAILIMGLLLERCGDFESSLEYLESVQAWPHVARVQLACLDYKAALKTCERVLSGTPEPVERLSALLTAGLANFLDSNLDGAVESFTDALSQSVPGTDGEENVLALLVKVLHASTDADARQAAQDQLFAHIEEHGPTLQITLLLGVVAVLDQDEAVMEAAKLELEQLVTPELEGESLAQACHVLALLDPGNKTFQRAVFQWPTEYRLWRRVDKQQALLIAEGQSTNAAQLSQALVEAPSVEHCKRAVFYDPLSETAWTALATEIQNNS